MICFHDTGEEVHITSCNGDFSVPEHEEIHPTRFSRSICGDEEDTDDVRHRPPCPNCEDQVRNLLGLNDKRSTLFYLIVQQFPVTSEPIPVINEI